MTLPVSGEMTAAMINVELGRASNAYFSIDGAAERALAGKPSGAISFSDFYGKSSGPPITNTLVAGSNIGNTGYQAGVMGSLSPTTAKGAPVNYFLHDGGSRLVFALNLPSGTGQGFIQSVTIAGVTYYGASATFYDYGFDELVWEWPTGNIFTPGNSYPMNVS